MNEGTSTKKDESMEPLDYLKKIIPEYGGYKNLSSRVDTDYSIRKVYVDLLRRLLLVIGTLTYGVFLWHDAFIQKANIVFEGYGLSHISFLFVFVIVMLSTLALSLLSYLFIEQPILEMKRKK